MKSNYIFKAILCRVFLGLTLAGLVSERAHVFNRAAVSFVHRTLRHTLYHNISYAVCHAMQLEECPICFLAYPALNRSRCCDKEICTECYLRVSLPLQDYILTRYLHDARGWDELWPWHGHALPISEY